MTRLFTLLSIGAASLLSSCHDDMRITGRIKPQQESSFFTDRNSSRPLVADTVVYRSPRNDEFFYRGSIGDRLVKGFPAPVTTATLAKGRQRYDIYCSVCHGLSGEGDGMIVQRGFPRPPSFHEQRLRDAPEGHFFSAMTNGYGVMYSYAARLTPEERWAVIAYIRALQLSRNARLDDVPVTERDKLESKAQ